MLNLGRSSSCCFEFEDAAMEVFYAGAVSLTSVAVFRLKVGVEVTPRDGLLAAAAAAGGSLRQRGGGRLLQRGRDDVVGQS